VDYPRISLVMVTYNESRYLRESLERLSFCDEMIVVDLGSDDDCVEIAKSFGAKVLFHERAPFGEKIYAFAAARASFEWILFADPDQYYPPNIGPRVKELIVHYADLPLGKILLPQVLYFGDTPLARGQKGTIHGRRTLINLNHCIIGDLVHHRGLILKPGAVEIGMIRKDHEVIAHHWVDRIGDAYQNARRYLPFEGEARHAQGRRFSWQNLAFELALSLRADLKEKAYLDYRALQVMVFQLWYIWQANMAWRSYQESLSAEA